MPTNENVQNCARRRQTRHPDSRNRRGIDDFHGRSRGHRNEGWPSLSVRLPSLSTIRLGKRTDGRSPYIRDFVPLANLNDLVFGGWDIYEDTAYEAAQFMRRFWRKISWIR